MKNVSLDKFEKFKKKIDAKKIHRYLTKFYKKSKFVKILYLSVQNNVRLCVATAVSHGWVWVGGVKPSAKKF